MQKTDELVNTLVKAVDEIQSKKAKGYDTQATVTRIEGSTAYVHIPGGVDETPAQLTINANKGDTVRVRVAGGTAWLVGNATNPPTDDATANAAAVVANTANAMAGEAIESANIAQEAAESAQASAAAAYTSSQEAKASAYNASEYASRALGNLSTVQSVAETLTWITQHGTMALTTDVTLDPTHVYFVIDPYGDYTVGGVTYSIVAEPDVADISTYYELSIDESLNNYVGTHLALTSEGLWLLPAASGTNKVLVATGAGTTYTTAGTYIINSSGGTEASFRADGSTIGENLSGYTRTQITSSGMEIIQKVSGTDKSVANFGATIRIGENAVGKSRVEISDSSIDFYYGQLVKATIGINNGSGYYTFGYRKSGSTIGNNSIVIGSEDTASGLNSIATGNNTRATGQAAFTEGINTEASANGAHAEGGNTTASGAESHAEGLNTTASGDYSHAEGYYSTASSTSAHAEGYQTTAGGSYSHAGGRGTKASNAYQTAIGRYNVENTGATYDTWKLFIVGNGSADNSRSDAFNVAYNGNVRLALDTSAASGTVDGDLYAAITALGWGSAVID